MCKNKLTQRDQIHIPRSTIYVSFNVTHYMRQLILFADQSHICICSSHPVSYTQWHKNDVTLVVMTLIKRNETMEMCTQQNDSKTVRENNNDQPNYVAQ